MALWRNTFHGDMISHTGIYAIAASAAAWIIVAAGDDGQGDFQGFFLIFIPQNSPLPPFLICLFLMLGFVPSLGH